MNQTDIASADIVADEVEQQNKEELISELLQKNIEGAAAECPDDLCGTPDQSSGGGCGCGCGSILIGAVDR